MKQSINYSALDETAKETKALEDVKFYLGDGYERICGHLREVTHYESFAFALSFVGVQGYPVRVLYNHLHGGSQ